MAQRAWACAAGDGRHAIVGAPGVPGLGVVWYGQPSASRSRPSCAHRPAPLVSSQHQRRHARGPHGAERVDSPRRRRGSRRWASCSKSATWRSDGSLASWRASPSLRMRGPPGGALLGACRGRGRLLRRQRRQVAGTGRRDGEQGPGAGDGHRARALSAARRASARRERQRRDHLIDPRPLDSGSSGASAVLIAFWSMPCAAASAHGGATPRWWLRKTRPLDSLLMCRPTSSSVPRASFAWGVLVYATCSLLLRE